MKRLSGGAPLMTSPGWVSITHFGQEYYLSCVLSALDQELLISAWPITNDANFYYLSK